MGNLCCGPRKPTEDVEEIPLTGVDSTSVIVTEQPGYINGDRQVKITNLWESTDEVFDVKADETTKPQLYITSVQDKLPVTDTAIENTHAVQVGTLKKHSERPLVLYSCPKVINSFHYVQLFNGTIFSTQSHTRAVSPDLKTIKVQQISIPAVQLFNITPKTMVQPKGVFQEYTTTLVTLHLFKVSFGMFEPAFEVFRSSTSIVNTNVQLMKSFSSTKPAVYPTGNCQIVDIVKHHDLALKSPLCVPVGTSIMMNFMIKGFNSHSLLWNGDVSTAVALDTNRTPASHIQVVFSFKADVFSWNHTLSMTISVGNTQNNVTDSENTMTWHIDILSVLAMPSSMLLKLFWSKYGRAQAIHDKPLPLDYDTLLAISDTPMGYNHRQALFEQMVLKLYGLIQQWSREWLDQTMVFRKLLRQTAGIEARRPVGWQYTRTLHVRLPKDIRAGTTYQAEDWLLRMTRVMVPETDLIVRESLIYTGLETGIKPGNIEPGAKKPVVQSHIHCEKTFNDRMKVVKRPSMFEYTSPVVEPSDQRTKRLPLVSESKREGEKTKSVFGDIADEYMGRNRIDMKIALELAFGPTDVYVGDIDKQVNTVTDNGQPREIDIDMTVESAAKDKLSENDEDVESESDTFGVDVSDVDSQASYGSLIMLSDTEDEQYWSESSSSDEEKVDPYRLQKRTMVRGVISQAVGNILFAEESVEYLSLATKSNEQDNDSNSESDPDKSTVATLKTADLIDNYGLMNHSSDSEDSQSWDLGDNANGAFKQKTGVIRRDSRGVAGQSAENGRIPRNFSEEKMLLYESYMDLSEEADGYISDTDADNYAYSDNDTDCDFSFSDIECDESFIRATSNDVNEFRYVFEARSMRTKKGKLDTDNEAELIRSLFSDSESEFSEGDLPNAVSGDHRVELDDPKKSMVLHVRGTQIADQNDILSDERDRSFTDTESEGETSDSDTDTDGELSEAKMLRALKKLQNQECNTDDPKQSRVLRKRKDDALAQDEMLSHEDSRSHTHDTLDTNSASDIGISDFITSDTQSEFTESELLSEVNTDKEVNIDDSKQSRVVAVEENEMFVQDKSLPQEVDYGHIQGPNGNNSDYNTGSEKPYEDDHGLKHEYIHDYKDNGTIFNDDNADYYYSDYDTDEYYEEDGPVLSYNFPYFTSFSSRQEELAYLEWQAIPPVNLDMRRCVLDTAENHVAAPRSEEDQCGSILAIREERERRREEAERLRRCVERYIF